MNLHGAFCIQSSLLSGCSGGLVMLLYVNLPHTGTIRESYFSHCLSFCTSDNAGKNSKKSLGAEKGHLLLRILNVLKRGIPLSDSDRMWLIRFPSKCNTSICLHLQSCIISGIQYKSKFLKSSSLICFEMSCRASDSSSYVRGSAPPFGAGS